MESASQSLSPCFLPGGASSASLKAFDHEASKRTCMEPQQSAPTPPPRVQANALSAMFYPLGDPVHIIPGHNVQAHDGGIACRSDCGRIGICFDVTMQSQPPCLLKQKDGPQTESPVRHRGNVYKVARSNCWVHARARRSKRNRGLLLQQFLNQGPLKFGACVISFLEVSH